MCDLRSCIIDGLTVLAKIGIPKTNGNKTQLEAILKVSYASIGVTLSDTDSVMQNETGGFLCNKVSFAVTVDARVRCLLTLASMKVHEAPGLECGFLALALLEQLLHHSDKCEKSIVDATAGQKDDSPTVSVQHAMVVENCCRLVLYSAVLIYLHGETRQFYELSIMKNRGIKLQGSYEKISPNSHNVLVTCTKVIMAVFKDEEYGTNVRQHLLGEVLNLLLELCFLPGHRDGYMEDCAWCRTELSVIMEQVSPVAILEHLLLIRSLPALLKGIWMLRIVKTLTLKRFILRPECDGVMLLLRAGLNSSKSDNWRYYEALADLVAGAPVPHLAQYYCRIGPQVAFILSSEECSRSGGLLSVISVIVSRMMQRSRSLTLACVGAALLHPLMELTQHPHIIISNALEKAQNNNVLQTTCTTKLANQKNIQTVENSDDTAKCSSVFVETMSCISKLRKVGSTEKRTECLKRSLNDEQNGSNINSEKGSEDIWKLYQDMESEIKSFWGERCCVQQCLSILHRVVVCGKGGAHCAALIGPVLLPLMAVASMTSPASSRQTALACIVEYLKGDCNINGVDSCVEKLKVLLAVVNSLDSPPLEKCVRFYLGSEAQVTTQPAQLSFDGSNIRNNESSKPDDRNELDEASLKAKVIMDILEKINNTKVIRKFFIDLPHHLEFDMSAVRDRLLLTAQEEAELELLQFSKVVTVSEVLGLLVDGSQMMEKMFSVYADAAPVLQSLLDAALRDCSSQDLMDIQSGFVLSVVMMTLQMLHGPGPLHRISRSDWDALQSLLATVRLLIVKFADTNMLPLLLDLEATICTRGAAKNLFSDLTDQKSKSIVSAIEKKLSDDEKTRRQLLSLKENMNKIRTSRNSQQENVSLVGAPNQPCDSLSDSENQSNVSTSKNNIINSKKILISNQNKCDENLDTRQRMGVDISNNKLNSNIKTLKEQDIKDNTHETDLSHGKSKKCKSDINSIIRNITLDEDDDEDEDFNSISSISTSKVKILDDSGFSTESSVNSSPQRAKDFINKDAAEHFSSYAEAIEECYSPLIPIKGHGLLSLAKLLDNNDKSAVANTGKLLLIFQHNLSDEDSYIYLAAAKGLAALCDASPDKTLPLVCSKLVSRNISAPDRAKIAETMTRAALRLGEMLPHYQHYFLNPLFLGVGDQDPLVRTACLSCLAEVVKELRHNVVANIAEILKLVGEVIQCETDVEPRRAVVLLVTYLLKAMEKDAFRVFQQELRDIYRALKSIARSDRDHETLVHVSLALDNIDAIVRSFILPKTGPLTKEIYITGPPPT